MPSVNTEHAFTHQTRKIYEWSTVWWIRLGICMFL